MISTTFLYECNWFIFAQKKYLFLNGDMYTRYFLNNIFIRYLIVLLQLKGLLFLNNYN